MTLDPGTLSAPSRGSDLSGSRALNTVYQNTTGRTIELVVALQRSVPADAGVSTAYLDELVDIGATNAVSDFSLLLDRRFNGSGTHSNTILVTGRMYVNPGEFYRIRSGFTSTTGAATSNDATVGYWYEVQF